MPERGARVKAYPQREGQRPLLIAVLVALFAVAALVGMKADPAEPANVPSETVPRPEPVPTLTLAAVGDVMCHLPQVRAAWDSRRGVYDFTPAFSEVAPYLSAADITLANLETVLDDSRPYRGYPRFNSPPALAQALAEAGVDLVTTANNHALDQGEAGVLATLKSLKGAGLFVTGTFADEAERGPLVCSLRGFKLAFLAYTLHTNGLVPPPGKEYLVNVYNAEQAAQDITAARTQGAEFVVVSMHWGQEYQSRPSTEQEELARGLLAAGADLILGSHPHVLQPLEEKIQPAGGKRALVAYSLGNFISSQRDPGTDCGLILYVTIARDPDSGQVGISSYWTVPTRVVRGEKIRVVPGEPYGE
ncbi:MAG: hypothetical protein PWQ86_908 [Bacillota bacterium]|nr:hypothetical protein [Bacillota bacterium]